ncbi:MAG: hypothetical protein WC761_06815 [Candidatus Paceibacterota bacterium]
MEINEDTPVSELIKRYEGNIRYDCHPVERRFNHSRARKELQRRGPAVLGIIGAYLLSLFPVGDFHLIGEKGWDEFLGWGYLLYGIVEDHNLPDCPYSGVLFGKQNMDVWIGYCFSHAKS